jgi:hypothetical protein
VDRLAEVLEALDTDEPGDALRYSCMFSDDDELNQGLTAEIIRSQHLTEQLEFLQVRPAGFLFGHSAPRGCHTHTDSAGEGLSLKQQGSLCVVPPHTHLLPRGMLASP